MRWRTGRRSENVEDRRGEGGLGNGSLGGRRPLRVGRTVGVGGGVGGLLLVVVLMLMGVDPSLLLTRGTQSPMGTTVGDPLTAPGAPSSGPRPPAPRRS